MEGQEKQPMTEQELIELITPEEDPNDTREKITEEENQDLINSWYEEAKNMDFEKFPEFIYRLNHYNHDYGTVVHAVAAATYATAQAMSGFHGITGFQAGFVTSLFLRYWSFNSNVKVGFRVLNYEDCLYPQYEYKFQNTIPQSVADLIKQEAQKNLETRSLEAHPDVIAHWEKLALGALPFGFTIKED